MSGLEGELRGPGTTEISVEIAGELISIPFEIWAYFNPVVLPLSSREQALAGPPFSRILDKLGIMGKLSKDEILLGFWLFMFGYGRFKAIKAAKPKKEKKPDVRDDSWKAGPGQDDAGKTIITGPPGPGTSGSGIHS